MAALSLSACDPGVSLHGRLTASDGQPLTVGEIRIECPELCLFAPVRGEMGRFDGSKLGRGCSLGCKLRAVSVGHLDFEAPAAPPYCIERSGSLCSKFEAEIALAPTP